MFPTICTIGPFTVYSYGIMLAVAFIVTSALAGIQARKQNISPDLIFNFLFVVFISGIIGARVFFIITNLSSYLQDPIEMIMLQRGGMSWFGGLLLGALAGTIYLKNKQLSIYRALDLIVPFVALGQAIGRIGCLLNGCCYGRVSEFGLYFPVHGLRFVPTQIYSSLALILIFLILRFLQDRPHKVGQIFFAYLLLYSLKRFDIEFWRSGHETVALGLNLYQIISILIFCISIIKLIQISKFKN